MPASFCPETTCWATPSRALRLDPSGHGADGRAGLREHLHPQDAEAGVAEALVALAAAHGRVADHRHFRDPAGGFPWSALVLFGTDHGLVVEVRPAVAERSAQERIFTDLRTATAIRNTVRHDLYAPLSTAASALEMLEEDLSTADAAVTDLARTIRTAVAAAASHSRALGTPRPTLRGPGACWVDSRVLVDALLAGLQPQLAQRSVILTRGVFPLLFAEPESLWGQLDAAMRALCVAARAGSHLHVEAAWDGQSLSLLHRTIREPAAHPDPWPAPPDHAG